MNDELREVETQGDATPVVVGPGARFEGLLSFWGRARVDGALRGDVVAAGTLEVGPAAAVAARIEVDVLVVEGHVEGNVVARERVEIRAGGRISAAVATPRLVLDEGGVLEGRVVMTGRSTEGGRAPSAAASAA